MEKEILEYDCFKENVNYILRNLYKELGFYLDVLDKRVEYHSPTGYRNGRGWVHWIYKLIPLVFSTKYHKKIKIKY